MTLFCNLFIDRRSYNTVKFKKNSDNAKMVKC